MVFLAVTRRGYDAYRALNSRAALWVADGVLAAMELDELRASGINVTTFNDSIEFSDPEALAGAVATIRQHHPGETLWVEGIHV